MWALLVVMLLNGTEVHLNPSEIVSLIEARAADDQAKHYTADVRCIVTTTDRREFTTREDCQDIERRLLAMAKARTQEMRK
jgi:hypothetical protein